MNKFCVICNKGIRKGLGHSRALIQIILVFLTLIEYSDLVDEFSTNTIGMEIFWEV